MIKTAHRRWAILLSALGATVVAIFYPIEEELPSQPQTNAPVSKPAVAKAALEMKPVRSGPIWIASREDPFAPRAWESEPAPVSTDTREIQPVEIVQAPAEQSPPPLPYTFLGQMQNDGELILYLGRGDQVLLARKGDVLENSYKVVEVSNAQIEFELLEGGVRQSLPIPAQ
jgi:hypothetical protein